MGAGSDVALKSLNRVCGGQVDSSRESAEAACDILSQLVNCSLKTLRLISTARPSFMELPKVSGNNLLELQGCSVKRHGSGGVFTTSAALE